MLIFRVILGIIEIFRADRSSIQHEKTRVSLQLKMYTPLRSLRRTISKRKQMASIRGAFSSVTGLSKYYIICPHLKARGIVLASTRSSFSAKNFVVCRSLTTLSANQAMYANAAEALELETEYNGNPMKEKNKHSHILQRWGQTNSVADLGVVQVAQTTHSSNSFEVVSSKNNLKSIDVEELLRSSETYALEIMNDLVYQGEGGLRQARELLDVLEKEKKSLTRHYNVLMKVCSLDDALATLQRMKQFGIRPDMISFHNLVTLYQIYGRTGDVAHLLKKIEASGLKTNNFSLEVTNRSEDDLMRLRVSKLSQMLTYGKHGRILAIELFSQLKATGNTNSIVYSIMLKACQNTRQVRELIAEMHELNIEANEATYGSIIR